MIKNLFNFFYLSSMKWLSYVGGIIITTVVFSSLYTQEVGFLGDEDGSNYRELVIATLIIYAFPLAFFWQYLENLFSRKAIQITFKTAFIAAAVPLLMIGSWLTISAFGSITSLLILVVCVGLAALIAMFVNNILTFIGNKNND